VSEFSPADVLDFWFGPPGSADRGRARDAWFVKDDRFDAAIRERFGAAIESALSGGLDDWARSPDSSLALVIVLDQFTRNVFRGTPRSFAGDPLALAVARGIVGRGWDAGLPPVWRSFVYLPFEHSEDLSDQREALRLFGVLRADPDAGGAYEWALRHHDVVARFGRFPHRNEILGRASTPEEIEFLKQPGSRF
jgi:uncharacterized protein (DUF924 family)